MSSKTKIFVLKFKEILYTVLFLVLAIIFVVLMIILITGKSRKKRAKATSSTYVPGVYTTSINLAGNYGDIRVMVDADQIKSIDMISSDETIVTSNPVLKSSLENISTQVIQNNSTQNITCNNDSRYTSLMLSEAIEAALSKALNK